MCGYAPPSYSTGAKPHRLRCAKYVFYYWDCSLITGNCQLLHILVIEAKLYPFGINSILGALYLRGADMPHLPLLFIILPHDPTPEEDRGVPCKRSGVAIAISILTLK